MHKTDIKKLEKYSDTGLAKEVFYDRGSLKAQAVCLKKGQAIPPCKMNHDVLFYIVSGKGGITGDNEKEELSAGTAVIVPKETETRSIRADEDMVILAVQGIYDRK